MSRNTVCDAEVAPLTIKRPLPRHKAVPELRRQIIEYLVEHRPPVGTWLLSDAELVRRAGVSRSTVRRALDVLQREGWIERQHGRGTYVGPRAELPLGLPSAAPRPGQSLIRLAVLIFRLGEWGHDWYSQRILQGIDAASEEQAVSIELLGGREYDIEAIRRRIMQHRPDVLACLAPKPRHTVVIGEARRLGIQCVGTGLRVLDLGLPAVYEDSHQGVAAAVAHLAEHGHERIGLALPSEPAFYVMTRREGYLEKMAELGLDADQNRICWLPFDPIHGFENQMERYPAMLEEHVRRHRLTALIGGSAPLVRAFGQVARNGNFRVPQELSLVTFTYGQEGLEFTVGSRGIVPTAVALPLPEIGEHIARLARQLVDGHEIAQMTCVPCRLMPGQTVAAAPSGA